MTMKDYMNDSIKSDAIESSKLFYENCGISVIHVKQKLQFALGIKCYLQFFEDLKQFVNFKHKDYRLFYFKDSDFLSKTVGVTIPKISMEEYIKIVLPGLVPYIHRICNSDDYFIFVIEFKTDDREIRKNIQEEFCNNLLQIVKRYNITSFLEFESEESSALVAFCSHVYYGYHYYLKERELKKCRKDSLESAKKVPNDACLIDFKDSYTIRGFINKVKALENSARTSALFATAFQYENNEGTKTLREEILPIYYYLLKIAKVCTTEAIINDGETIYLGLKKEKFDAKINDTLFEVTVALDEKEYLIRRHLCCFNGKLNMPLDYRTYNQLLIDSFPLPILKAIQEKCKKHYVDESDRILIVATLFEFAEYNNELINLWIPYIKNNMPENKFKQIVLMADDKVCILK